MFEWQRLEPARSGPGAVLYACTLGDDPQAITLAADLARAGVVTVTELRAGLQVETGSFVGRIAVGPLDLTILPKIAWSRWHRLLGFAMRLDDVQRSDNLDASVNPSSLQDLIVLQLVHATRALLSRGLHREYERQRRALPVPRGRIDFARIARGGVRDASIPSRFTRRVDDTLLNQALAGGMRLAAQVASDGKLRMAARQLEQEIASSVIPVSMSAALLRDARNALDRRTARYEPILRLIELLASGLAVVVGGDDSDASIRIPGFAVDMNRLWQRLLGRVLSEWVPGIDVHSEVTLADIFEFDPAYETRPNRPLPRPRPDFAVRTTPNGSTMFLDAKYRDLWSTPIPRDMLYQLSLYAIAQREGPAVMLYPTDKSEAVEERLNIRNPADGSVQASVALRPVDLSELERLVDLHGTSSALARDRFARRIIGLEPGLN